MHDWIHIQRYGHRSNNYFYFYFLKDIKNFYRLERKLMVEERMCMPIAAFLGSIGGFINEYLRIKGNFKPFTFEKVDDPFTEEI